MPSLLNSLAVRYFASVHFMYSIGDAEPLSKNTVCRAARKVGHALFYAITEVFLICIGWAHIQNTFSIGIPRVIGAIDCTHIPIRAPLEEHEGDYVNRKSFLIFQMTCDHHLMVTSLEARWLGSVHDSRVFQESTLGQRFEQGRFDGLLLGDRGYPCLRYLMTPYPDPQAREQIKYNVAHSNTRIRIEMTFGVIKARFACLQALWVHVERACEVVAACVVLHNIATIRKERAPCQLPMPPDLVDTVTLDHPTGRAVREAITNQFFNQ
ncbi:HARB1 nuclease, partial [Amia calva]|nr:HARB1 nuclease [Amia calva]